MQLNLLFGVTLCLIGLLGLVECGPPDAPMIEHFGSMHETIGQKKHQGRVELSELLARPNFYAVGALEQLRGELTIFDSQAVVTGVGSNGAIEPLDKTENELQATLLVGGEVATWRELAEPAAVASDQFDRWISDRASSAGIDVEQPFMFLIEGEFAGVHVHVINGACPVHARRSGRAIDPPQRPYERQLENVRGTVVGLFAKDAAGKFTHPGTTVHAHLIFRDELGRRVTGHLEQVGLVPGAVLRVPARQIGTTTGVERPDKS